MHEHKIIPLLFRKMYTILGHAGPGLGLIGLSFVGCNEVAAVAALTIAMGFSGFVYSGFVVSYCGVRKYSNVLKFT